MEVMARLPFSAGLRRRRRRRRRRRQGLITCLQSSACLSLISLLPLTKANTCEHDLSPLWTPPPPSPPPPLPPPLVATAPNCANPTHGGFSLLLIVDDFPTEVGWRLVMTARLVSASAEEDAYRNSSSTSSGNTASSGNTTSSGNSTRSGSRASSYLVPPASAADAAVAAVGLCKLNSVYAYLESAWFQPLNIEM
jgi:hypothetical protein